MADPQAPPEPPDGFIQAAVGLADTPLGQRVAITLTILLGRDAATAVAGAVKQTAEQMSASGLVVAAPGAVPVNGKAADGGQ